MRFIFQNTESEIITAANIRNVVLTLAHSIVMQALPYKRHYSINCNKILFDGFLGNNRNVDIIATFQYGFVVSRIFHLYNNTLELPHSIKLPCYIAFILFITISVF